MRADIADIVGTGKPAVMAVIYKPSERTLVDPFDLVEDPDIKSLRTWTKDGSTLQELDLPSMAQSMYDEGQLVPVIVRPTDDGLMIVDGQRRVEAAKLIRQNVDAEWLIWVDVAELDDKQARKVAIHATLKRRDFTKIELARIIKSIREECPEAASCTEWVADYLSISTATVTQAERLLSAPVEMQDKVQAGAMSAEAVLEFLNTKPTHREEVKKKAEKIAKDREEKEKEKTKEKGKGKKKDRKPTVEERVQAAYEKAGIRTPKPPVEKPTAPPAPSTPPAPTPAPTPTVARVLRKDINAAQREVPGSVEHHKAPKMADVAALFGGMTGYSAVLETFVRTMERWAAGKLKTGAEGVREALEDVQDELSRGQVE